MNNEEKKVNEELDEEVKNETPDTEETKEEEAGEEQTEDQADTEEKSEEDEALNSKYLRLMADFQNYKRRVEKEKSDIYAYANEKLVSQLLDVIDNFERALLHEAADESFVEGMKMIFKQLTGVLEKAGLEEINALGEDFDPNFHNAVMTEDNDDYDSGKVTEVMQKGYLLNKKVIRPSMVKVNN
ncbi:HSP-70 cofactor [uncultured Eubacterium sp.]|uniref:nucleotide exchange factor GrpE n=1 Tax=Emergencia sp. TaxID=1926557 RepID=UPI0008211866|nr:HSP-70 cofactor [uncultured Eubacterium sp.]